MRIVVDASVVLGVCLANGELSSLHGHSLHAPAHLPSVVTSALREAAFRGEISSGEADAAVGRLHAVPIAFAAPGSHALEAFRLAERLGWAKTYDAEYLALAQALDAPLVTVDARLQRGASSVVQVIGPTDLGDA